MASPSPTTNPDFAVFDPDNPAMAGQSRSSFFDQDFQDISAGTAFIYTVIGSIFGAILFFISFKILQPLLEHLLDRLAPPPDPPRLRHRPAQ
jgi:hypothetical protein